jgi:DisA bacterial checkpoint controller nucleotide-binding
MYAFPQQLTRTVISNWESLVVGPEYDRPELPPHRFLKRLIEVCYLVSLETDESRALRFTVCCSTDINFIRRHNSDVLIESLKFNNKRDFNIGEIRRLAATTDVDSSAIWISYSPKDKAGLRIVGLINQGSSWASARRVFSYWYTYPPSALIIRVLGPGRLSVYQGIYLVATLASGQIQETTPTSELEHLGITEFLLKGYERLSLMVCDSELYLPTLEPIKYEPWGERKAFEWGAYWNTILAIVNIIQSKGHGGALILVQEDSDLLRKPDLIKIKYGVTSDNDALQKRFVEFIRLRNAGVELEWQAVGESANVSINDASHAADNRTKNSFQSLVETSTFIGNLAGADGAIVLTSTFRIVGFSAEITAEMMQRAKIYAVLDQVQRKVIPLDVEQFGMRHRSAINLCSNTADAIVFVVSQDGDVSLIWRKNKHVRVKKGINITNANMVLA